MKINVIINSGQVTTLVNLSNEYFVNRNGERICQMVIAKHGGADLVSVDAFLDSDRGRERFDHTGKN
jgi:dUTP pyrophosphatase